MTTTENVETTVGHAPAPKVASRAEQAYDHELRTLQVVDMAAVLGTEQFDTAHLDDPLDSFVEALLERPFRHPSLEALGLMLGYPGWEKDEDEEEAEHARQVLCENAYRADNAGFHGLGVQFGTPARKYLSANSYSASFGCMRTTWVYAETFEQAWQLGVEWAISQHEKDMQKSGFGREVANG
ncbi:hypothetical protein [Pseudomonas kurunegalensis]|uniref:hypothetical protein n=1 Tax=Pseudomonas kurunegalensis TaxID=485880 RepID=UPI00211746B0|nr:hypothetical protein [Pseudomonas kurunegalensis]